MVQRAISDVTPQAALECILIRMGLTATGRSTVHQKLMARSNAFKFAAGEVPVKHHIKFSHIGHQTRTTRYQDKRTFFKNEGIGVLQFLRNVVRETQGSEAATIQLVRQHRWDRGGGLQYDDVMSVIHHILGGNTDGMILSREDLEREILPLLDPEGKGVVSLSTLIDCLYAHEQGFSAYQQSVRAGVPYNAETP